jgi:hypothetical protein
MEVSDGRTRQQRVTAGNMDGGYANCAGDPRILVPLGSQLRLHLRDGRNISSFADAISRAEQEEYDAMRMQEIDVFDYARQLLEAHGDKAVAEAAQKACALEEQGQNEQAETWRRVEAALKQMRGPHEK